MLEGPLEDDEAEAVCTRRCVEIGRGPQRARAGVVGERDQERLAGDVTDAVAEAGGEASERRRPPSQGLGHDDEARRRESGHTHR